MSDERFFDRLYELYDGDDVRRHYDRFAADYDNELTSRGCAQPARVAAAVAAGGLAAEARILDAGCGSGLSGRALAEQGYGNVVGCDYSAEMLARAEQTGVYRSLHRVDLNASPLEVPGSPFDAVTAVGVVGHGHVGGAAIVGLVDLLVPGGLLALAINELAWPDGDSRPALDALVGAGVIEPYRAEVGDHIPGLGSRGWVITTRRR
ncbi:MAG: methyltransferase domain-containing protein [Acidimicrobiia bacterium]|nr:methyltransferase domain-containing protein [Acidimicrobiia bacterium]